MRSMQWQLGILGNISVFVLHTSHPAYEDGTDRVFRNVGIQQSDAGETPKRIHTRFKTRRKFEIKKSRISVFAYRHRETKKTLCRGGRSQDLPNTDL